MTEAPILETAQKEDRFKDGEINQFQSNTAYFLCI